MGSGWFLEQGLTLSFVEGYIILTFFVPNDHATSIDCNAFVTL